MLFIRIAEKILWQPWLSLFRWGLMQTFRFFVLSLRIVKTKSRLLVHLSGLTFPTPIPVIADVRNTVDNAPHAVNAGRPSVLPVPRIPQHTNLNRFCGKSLILHENSCTYLTALKKISRIIPGKTNAAVGRRPGTESALMQPYSIKGQAHKERHGCIIVQV